MNIMQRVLLIGNTRGKVDVYDGGSIKVNLYKQCLESCGVEVELIDLFNWKKHPISLLIGLINNIKKCNSVLIMGGPKGSRLIIPLVVRLNKKTKVRTVYCPLGTGTIEHITKGLNDKETVDFINGVNFYNRHDNKMQKYLSKLSIIIPQNATLTNLYKKFYELNNVETLLNFRNTAIVKRTYKPHKPFKVIYLSRVAKEKGILLLMEAINELDDVSLDIYGQMQLNESELVTFNTMLRNPRINYKGICNFSNTISLLSDYDLFCLPTMYKGEGTSGSFIESLIAGTPALLSSYSQAKELVEDNVSGFIFELGNKQDLINRLMIIKNADLVSVSKKSQLTAEKYLFSYNKDNFIRLILGDEQ